MAEKKKNMFTWFMGFSFYKKFLLPGFIAQSVIVAGGYGTGRELVEYFVQYGPTGGLMGMMFVTVVLWAIIFALSYEFARVFKAYDYRSFFKNLLGPGWILYEICYIVLLAIVLGVVGAASGSILESQLGIPGTLGAGVFLVGIAALTYFGSSALEVVLSWWSYLLYAIYLTFLIVGLSKVGGTVVHNFQSGIIKEGWAMGGFKYAFYNLGAIPAVLFAVKYIETRREALLSGVLTAVMIMLPGLFFYLITVGFYPAILDIEIPAYFMLGKIASWLLPLYVLMLFGTMVETGAGLIHSVNERINSYRISSGKEELTRPARGIMGLMMALMGVGVASFGLIGLVAKGYGTISWVFFILHGVALMTWGVFKIYRKTHSTEEA